MKRRGVLAFALTMAGCVGPKPGLPVGAQVTVPADWRTPDQPGQGIVANWWAGLGDPALNALVAHVLDSNTDLLVAGARIEEARARLRLARSSLVPSVDAGIVGGPGRTLSSGQGVTQTSITGELSISYEVDLFGRLSAGREARRQDLAASMFAREGVRVGLVATTVAGYVDLIGLDRQLQLVEATLRARQQELEVVRRRYQAGYAAQLDLRQAEAALEAAARLVPATRQAIFEQEAALSLLAGDPPRQITRDRTLDQLAAVAVPHALPSAVLRQRPDIAEAEARLASADRDLAAARAAFMPRLQLTAGGGGVASTALGGPVSLFTLGGSILAPLFEGGALRAGADAATARRDQAAFAYRKTVLTALQETEVAMQGVERLAEQRDAAAREAQSTRAALDLARKRYRLGYAAYIEQLDAERSLLAVELEQARLEADRWTALVSLYRALGGGWSTDLIHDGAGHSVPASALSAAPSPTGAPQVESIPAAKDRDG
jgi:outer membrane protein, multidrug efflux system